MVFEILFGDLAQMVAQLILSQKVVGSNPSVPAFVTVMVDSVSLFLLLFLANPLLFIAEGDFALYRCFIDV